MKLSFRKAILLYTLIPIIVIFILFALENLHSVNLDTSQRIKQHMSDLAISYANIFDGFLLPIAGAAKTNAELMEIYPEINEDKIFSILELQVAQNPLIYGAAIAFMPHQYEKNRRLVAPYVYRKKGKLSHKQVMFFLGRTETEEVKISHEHRGHLWLPYGAAHKKVTFDNAKNLLEKAEKVLS